jgi:hypothetical protein
MTETVSMIDPITEGKRREVRPFQDADETDTAAVWHRSGLAAYPYLPTWQAMTLETAQWVFHNVIRAECAIWVGTLDGRAGLSCYEGIESQPAIR